MPSDLETPIRSAPRKVRTSGSSGPRLSCSCCRACRSQGSACGWGTSEAPRVFLLQKGPSWGVGFLKHRGGSLVLFLWDHRTPEWKSKSIGGGSKSQRIGPSVSRLICFAWASSRVSGSNVCARLWVFSNGFSFETLRSLHRPRPYLAPICLIERWSVTFP